MAVLDTSFVVDIFRAQNGAGVLYGDLEHKERVLSVTPVTVMELWSGALRSSRTEEEREKIGRLLSRVPCIPFDSQTAELAGKTEALLSKEGVKMSVEDLMIAATALRHGETLVTRDRDFTKIPGLRVLTY